jgi:hypothetical protein
MIIYILYQEEENFEDVGVEEKEIMIYCPHEVALETF